MFASKTPRDLNHDPEPWQAPWPNLRRSESRSPFNVHDRWEHKPRPEFDHAQHNEPNPILVAFREDARVQIEDGMDVIDVAVSWIEGESLGDDGVFVGYDPDFLDHARKVLTRLARLEEANDNPLDLCYDMSCGSLRVHGTHR
jgi:hypothetical protein